MPDNSLSIDRFLTIADSIDILLLRTKHLNSAEEFKINPDGLTLLDSVSMRLQFIGETLKKIDKDHPALLIKYDSVEWYKIINLRDFISHHYDLLNYQIIFTICKENLPEFKEVVEKIISDLRKS